MPKLKFVIQSEAALREASNRLDISIEDASLLREGNNAVFHLPRCELVARVSRPGADMRSIENELSFIELLVSKSLAVPRLPAKISQNPLVTQHGVVTFFRFIEEHPSTALDYHALGKLIADVHREGKDFAGELEQWDPFAKIDSRFGALVPDFGVSQEDINLLRDWAKRLKQEFDGVKESSELGRGPIHGDVYEGNIRNGLTGPVLLDFERIAFGPREWDFVPLAVSVRRLGQNPNKLEEFIQGYGCDVREWPGFETLCRVRELRQTSYLISILHRPEVQEEFQKRMRHWRDPKDNSVWSAL